jgi:DeoR family transcriptional regulator of aga operon
MVKAAEKVVAVCDSSKFNRRRLSLIFGTSTVDHVITDGKLPVEEIKVIRDARHRSDSCLGTYYRRRALT